MLRLSHRSRLELLPNPVLFATETLLGDAPGSPGALYPTFSCASPLHPPLSALGDSFGSAWFLFHFESPGLRSSCSLAERKTENVCI